MGAVCYKPRPTTITKDDILKALNDKHIKESITEPDGSKTMKTDEQGNNHMLTFGTLTQQLNIDTYELNTNQQNTTGQRFPRPRQSNLNPYASSGFGQLELNILTYYGHKDDIYETLTKMSRKTLFFMKKNYRKIESMDGLRQSNEKIRFVPVKSIEEHQSGVNQLLKINSKELVTASDDCYMKFWSSQTMKVEASLPTETITCIALTGSNNKQQKEILVAGCHSGNLIIISVSQRTKKEQFTSAHYNLIRVIVTLEALKNRYFVTADVCGVVKVWTSQFKPQQVMEIEQEGAISYNSMIEVCDMLPRRSSYEDTAMIACALKSQKINLILLIPSAGTYQLIKTLKSTMKPTCLIQLSSKNLAIAVGSLKEDSHIEVHDMNKNRIVSTLRMHKDMIDSMLKVEFPPDKLKSSNPYITWFLSASRDRQIVLWKLIDGKIMRRNHQNLINSGKKSINTPGHTPSNGGRTYDQFKSKQSHHKLDNKRKNKKARQGEEDDLLDDQESDIDNGQEEGKGDFEEEKQKTIEKDQHINKAEMIDYYQAFDTGHKDFIRSMVQINNGNTLITASEDKTIKVFTISF